MTDGTPQKIKHRAGLFLGIGLMYLAAYQMFKLPPILPVLLESFHYDRTLAGCFMSVYAAVGLFLSVPLGRLVARQGPVSITGISIVIMIAGNILGLWFPESGITMLFARSLEGMGFAGFAIVGPVLANRNASQSVLPIVISLTAIWIPVGQLIAAGVTPIVLPVSGWQTLWWIGILGTIVLGVIAIPVLRTQPFTYPGNNPLSEELDIKPLQRVERRHLVIAASVFTLFSIQYFAFMTWLPQYLVEAMGMSLVDSAVGYIMPIVMMIMVSFMTGWMIRTGYKTEKLMIVGMVLISLLWGLVPLAGIGMWGILFMIIYGVGAGMTPTCLFAMPATIVGPNGATADAFGIIMTGRNLGVLVGPVLLAWIFTVSGTWTYISPVFFMTSLVGCCMSIYLYHRLKS